MKRLAAFTLVALASCSTPTDPGDLQPQDFAVGLSVTPSGQEPFFRVDLPDYVYTGTAWPDLRDIRVFNAAGELVPFARLTPPRPEGDVRRIPLQPFRLTGSTPGNVPQVELETSGRGVALRVVNSTEPAAAAEYILATTEHEAGATVERLDLSWLESPSSWQQRVSVSTSADLQSWFTVAPGRPVMDLKTDDGRRLIHAEVPVTVPRSASARYWRIRFDPGVSPTLTEVHAVVRGSAPQPRGVLLPVVGAQGPDGIVYRLPSRQPIASVRIAPAESNSVLPMSVEARLGDDEPWRTLARTVAYRINAPDAGGEQYSPPVPTGGALVSEIRLRPIGPPITRAPYLEVERDAMTLIVNARGTGPFLLAWGSRAADDGALPLTTLVPGYLAGTPLDFPYARLAASVEALGGQARLTELAPAERTARVNVALVWAGLLAGAGALAFLAFRVWRESAR